MIAFLAGGSKFLFFDAGICRTALWSPSGSDSSPRVADSCSLGRTGYVSIAAGATFFLMLLVICLKAPKKRDLQKDDGDDLIDHDDDRYRNYHDGDMASLDAELDIESDIDGLRTITVDHNSVSPGGMLMKRKQQVSAADDYNTNNSHNKDVVNYNEGGAYDSYEYHRDDSFSSSVDHHQRQDDSFDAIELVKDPSNLTRSFDRRDDELISKPSSNDSDERIFGRRVPAPNELPPRPGKTGTMSSYASAASNPSCGGNSASTSITTTTAGGGKSKISQTRLTKAEMLQSSHHRKASNELIDKVVQDLERSFQSSVGGGGGGDDSFLAE